MIRGIICDLDGTLIDSEPLHHRTYRTAFEEFGLPFDTAQYASMFGTNGEGFVMRVMGEKADAEVARAVVDRKTELYHRFLSREGMEAAPGARAFLERMTARYKLALATATRGDNLPPIFQLLGFDGFFDAVVSADDAVKSKPDPAPFLLAASRLVLTPAECVAVEDGVHGVAAAKAAGMACIGVTACDSFHRDLSAADVVVDSLDDISYETVDRLGKEPPHTVDPKEGEKYGRE